MSAEDTPADPRFAEIREAGGDRYRAFLDAGYREYHYPGRRATPYALCRFVRGDAGNKLFNVVVWCYDWSRNPAVPADFAVQPECQFNTHADSSRVFDVTLHAAVDDGPAEIEAFFRAIYDRMGCHPYDPPPEGTK